MDLHSVDFRSSQHQCQESSESENRQDIENLQCQEIESVTWELH